MTTDTPKPKPKKRRLTARRTTGRSAGISQSAFAGYGHQQPAQAQKTPEAEPQQETGNKESADDANNAPKAKKDTD